MRVIHGDCLDVMPTLDRVDAVVTDPPYGLTFMGRHWDKGVPGVKFWLEMFDLLPPGGWLLAFSGTRTYHRMACAIEDAGFEIRDQIQWLYGSGFPKSHDVSKAIDRAAGVEREVVGQGITGAAYTRAVRRNADEGFESGQVAVNITAPSTPDAQQWDGWGTALKPACEPICMARKPLAGTVAGNVLEHGTGALNVDGCRVGVNGGTRTVAGDRKATTVHALGDGLGVQGGWVEETGQGRWPANVIHDGSPEVMEAFARFGESKSTGGLTPGVGSKTDPKTYAFGDLLGSNAGGLGDTGTAARFFYSAKADSADRLDSKHPTVKPVDLMAYLVRLVTPPGGTVLDPFAGSGTTGMACLREGVDCVLIEREEEYIADINRRLDHVKGLDTPLFAGA